MLYVLDTCTFLWLATDHAKLSLRARQVLAEADQSFHLSAISVTETHRLIRKGKIALQANVPLDVWFRRALAQHQVVCEPITLAIAHAAEVLPAIHHDPADRFILATAKILGGSVLSPDTILPQYPGIPVEW